MAAASEIALGIDLGTTNSCAAYVQEGRPRIIPSGKGYATVPSVVGFSKKGEIIVGHPALDQMVTNPADTIYGSKRLIGRKFNSLIVEKMRQTMMYPIVEGPDSETAVLLGGKVFTLPRIAGLILTEIREMAQGQLQHEIRRAIITVPAYYSDNQRQAVKDAGEMAGFQVERIVNEPTAAAIAYGFNKGFNQKILVYDLGGGTFDVSILHVHGNEFQVLATGGDTFLGGVDFDTRIAEYALQKFQEASGKDIRTEKVAMQRVRAAAERAKRDLSTEKSVKVHLPFITEINADPVDLALSLSREQINRLTGDLVERTLGICDEVLDSVGMKKSELNEILLVGGQTRMPLVQGKIHEHFARAPRKGVHPDEVVALGAAVLANPEAVSATVTLKDVLSIPIGVALGSGRLKVIMDRNIPLPATKSYKVALQDGQGLEIDIYQGDKPQILEDEYLGTFQFPAPTKGEKGGRQLEMKFDLSPECLLRVQARDLDSGEETSAHMVTLQTPKSLKESMARAVKEQGGQKTKWFSALAQRILGQG
ncbi:MAG TPA: Hsp70 family protein [Bdellovibrionota bacterium]|nr:Hsp70 family protein [Bdellovibrionota bacterium]